MGGTKRARAGTRSNPIVIAAPARRGWKKRPASTKARIPRYLSGGEKKFIDTDVSTGIGGGGGLTALTGVQNNASLATSAVALNFIPTGTSTSARVGRFAMMTKLTYDLDFYHQIMFNAATIGGLNNQMTAYLVYTKVNSTAGPSWVDILMTQSPHSLRNPNHTQEFQILKRWDISFGPVNNANAAINPTFLPFALKQRRHGSIKLNKPVKFTSASTTPIAWSDVEFGLLQLYVVSDLANNVNLAQYVLGNVRVDFTDAC